MSRYEENEKADIMFQSLTSLGGSSQSSIASFHLTLLDVNDNPPRLAKEYTGLFLCHPLHQEGTLIFEVTDDDQRSLSSPRFSYSLVSESSRNDWEVSRVNGELNKTLTDDKISFYLPWCACGGTQHRVFPHAAGRKLML